VQTAHLATCLLGELRIDPTGQHRVDLDVVFRPGGRERFGELHGAALARRIGCRKRCAKQARHRTDGDDLAAAGALQVGIHRLSTQKRSPQIDVDHAGPLLERVLLGRLADVGACVGDQHIDAAIAFDRQLCHRQDGCFVAHVDHGRAHLGPFPSQLGLRSCRFFRVPRSDEHAGAGLCEAPRHAETDTPVAAGHDRHPPRQIKRRSH
jgi:hypothetical protein